MGSQPIDPPPGGDHRPPAPPAEPTLPLPTGWARSIGLLPEDILDGARETVWLAGAAEAHLLRLAAEWAAHHEIDDPMLAAHVQVRDEQLPILIAGEGAPLIAATCIPEFAATIHRSTEAGRRLIGAAVELRHRLPRLWRLVHDHVVPTWRAVQVTEHTLTLSRAAAEFVDRQLAACPGQWSWPQVERAVRAAKLQFLAKEAAEEVADREAGLHVTIEHDRTGRCHGVAHVDASLDAVDALDLDHALSHGARQLAAGGSTETLQVRRARALGDLARGQAVLDLTGGGETSDGAGRTQAQARRTPARPMIVYFHLSEGAVRGAVRVGRLGNTRIPVTTDQIRTWLNSPGAKIIIKPVIDLGDTVAIDRYETGPLRERVTLRNDTCAFPWCRRPAHPVAQRVTRDGRPSHAVDLDHTQPYGEGGSTCTDNLAPLCRLHHVIKTFTRWRYHRIGPDAFVWTSPHGRQYLCDPAGTRGLSPPPFPRRE